MKYSADELKQVLKLPSYPRSADYDPEWVLENQMGPNVLWLTEALCQVVKLDAGMRVLDLGCGRAISSIFMAREFGVKVWAADLWIDPKENWERVLSAKMEEMVMPIHAEAHSLPFADGFFDAIVSMDAYHYFGTDDLYIGYITRFLRSGGQFGIIVPGLKEEFTAGVPTYLRQYWEWEYCTFHSSTWWRNHWDKSAKVQINYADFLPEGSEQWLKWLDVRAKQGYPDLYGEAKEAEMLKIDAGRNLGFTRIAARKN